MNKVWLYTYWFMAGKESGDESKRIDRAWLTSILPPFYRGTGISIRIKGWTIKFGVCYPRMPVTVDEYSYVGTEENLDALLGYELEQQEIRKWRYSTAMELAAKKQETSTQTLSDESSSESPPTTS